MDNCVLSWLMVFWLLKKIEKLRRVIRVNMRKIVGGLLNVLLNLWMVYYMLIVIVGRIIKSYRVIKIYLKCCKNGILIILVIVKVGQIVCINCFWLK